MFQVLSDISSCRDHRSVTSSVTRCLWGDSVSGPCDGQGIEQDQHWMRHTVVRSEPGASYVCIKGTIGLRKMVGGRRSYVKIGGPCVL